MSALWAAHTCGVGQTDKRGTWAGSFAAAMAQVSLHNHSVAECTLSQADRNPNSVVFVVCTRLTTMSTTSCTRCVCGSQKGVPGVYLRHEQCPSHGRCDVCTALVDHRHHEAIDCFFYLTLVCFPSPVPPSMTCIQYHPLTPVPPSNWPPICMWVALHVDGCGQYSAPNHETRNSALWGQLGTVNDNRNALY